MKQILLLTQNALKVLLGIPLAAFFFISYYYMEGFWDKGIMLLGLFLIIRVIKFNLTDSIQEPESNSENM